MDNCTYNEVIATTENNTLKLIYIGNIIVSQDGISSYWVEGNSYSSFEGKPLGIQLFLIGYLWCLYNEDPETFSMIVDQKFYNLFGKQLDQITEYCKHWFEDCLIPRDEIFPYHYYDDPDGWGEVGEQKFYHPGFEVMLNTSYTSIELFGAPIFIKKEYFEGLKRSTERIFQILLE